MLTPYSVLLNSFKEEVDDNIYKLMEDYPDDWELIDSGAEDLLYNLSKIIKKGGENAGHTCFMCLIEVVYAMGYYRGKQKRRKKNGTAS